jgi:hypothetical protein
MNVNMPLSAMKPMGGVPELKFGIREDYLSEVLISVYIVIEQRHSNKNILGKRCRPFDKRSENKYFRNNGSSSLCNNLSTLLWGVKLTIKHCIKKWVGPIPMILH